MSEWISIEDRLPELGERVITIREDGHIEVQKMLFKERCQGNDAHFSNEARQYGLVTHYLPLPEPPK